MAPLLRRVVAVVGLVVMTSLATLLVSGKMKVRIERNTLAAQLDAASTTGGAPAEYTKRKSRHASCQSLRAHRPTQDRHDERSDVAVATWGTR